MTLLYPMKFQNQYFEKIWGGQNIKTILGLDYGRMTNCGEAWLISGVDGHNSVVANGSFEGDELNDLVETFMGDFVGEKVFDKYGERFPILVKIIDPVTWLSVQVHPDDSLAQKIGLENGKTEMWYVMHASDDATLVSGFNQNVSKEEFEKLVNDKKVSQVLNYEHVKEGDVYFIPARRIHALGPGCMVAEIQQTSDTTFRVYDWDRIDQYGMYRELHIPQALATLDFKKEDCYHTHYDKATINSTVPVVDTPFFTTNIIRLEQAVLKKDYSELDSFVILMCIENSFVLRWDGGELAIGNGECVLIPNAVNRVEICSAHKAKILETYIA